MHLEGMAGHALHRAGLDGQRHEGELQIGMLDPGAAADEGAGLEVIGRCQPAAGQEPLQPDQEFPRRPGRGIDADGLAAEMLDDDVGMIVQIGAHPRQVMADGDAELGQMIGRTDAGELQELRAVEGSAAEDHLPLGPRAFRSACAEIIHPHGAPALEADRPRQRAGQDGEIGAPCGAGQIAARHAPAPAVPGRPVHRAEALLLLAIGIGGIGISRLLPRLDEGAGERRGIIGRGGDEERTLAAVIVARRPSDGARRGGNRAGPRHRTSPGSPAAPSRRSRGHGRGHTSCR